ncbi:hypothetical protein lbkm_1738 [Lachnospiraceae bacterium KM106-2]|nr:hypothetical protein lbkm_1738 [Lachnospiraceae bacterium KM106-2]
MELVERMIGKSCEVCTIDDREYGIIKEVDDGWLLMETQEGDSVVNLEYVTYISEWKENNKKKAKPSKNPFLL